MAGWDAAYDKCFREDIPDEEYNEAQSDYVIIPTVPVKALRQHVKKVLATVNKTEMTLPQFAAFKYEVLKSEAEWGEDVFEWKMIGDNKFGIDVKWDVLGDDPRRYALVHMAIENCWGLGLEWETYPNLPNLWEVIDPYRN